MGPASNTFDMLEKLFLAGVDVFRLNFRCECCACGVLVSKAYTTIRFSVCYSTSTGVLTVYYFFDGNYDALHLNYTLFRGLAQNLTNAPHSHGSHDEKAGLVDLIRELEFKHGKPIAILADLQVAAIVLRALLYQQSIVSICAF